MTAFRSHLFNFLMPATAVLWTVLLFPCLLSKPLSRWVCQCWARTVLWELRIITGLDYRIEGEEYIPTGAALVAARHQTMWETLGLMATLPNPVFILKQELLDIPFFGWWVAGAGSIAIDRKAGAKSLRQMTRSAQEAAGRGDQIIIFPEGSRIPPGKHAEYQPGVIGLYRALKLPCVPVAHNSGCYWRHPGPDRLPGAITLQFLPAIETGMDKEPFLDVLQQQITEKSDQLLTGTEFEPHACPA